MKKNLLDPEDYNSAFSPSRKTDYSPDYVDGSSPNRSFFTRSFGPMAPGSIRGSIFTMLSVAIGAGLLSLPYTFAENGFALMTLFMVLSALFTMWSMRLII